VDKEHDEEEELRSVALQNAKTILLARQRVDQGGADLIEQFFIGHRRFLHGSSRCRGGELFAGATPHGFSK
jgi:hypothetical protein